MRSKTSFSVIYRPLYTAFWHIVKLGISLAFVAKDYGLASTFDSKHLRGVILVILQLLVLFYSMVFGHLPHRAPCSRKNLSVVHFRRSEIVLFSYFLADSRLVVSGLSSSVVT